MRVIAFYKKKMKACDKLFVYFVNLCFIGNISRLLPLILCSVHCGVDEGKERMSNL